ncbi:putative permease fragment/subunit [Oenococcus oeni]|nr:putative permease fragment/subunit [Oenococcus oeni]SYW12745.1 putative permease fragment/subunit [Oenococcus oeni]SYW17290.1 putative permease fragment/subunit [Oenococcus oeni]
MNKKMSRNYILEYIYITKKESWQTYDFWSHFVWNNFIDWSSFT